MPAVRPPHSGQSVKDEKKTTMITMAQGGPLLVATPRCHYALPGSVIVTPMLAARSAASDSTPGRLLGRRCRDYAHSRGTLAASRPAKPFHAPGQPPARTAGTATAQGHHSPAPRRTEYSVRRGWLVLAQRRSSRAERRVFARVLLSFSVTQRDAICRPSSRLSPRLAGLKRRSTWCSPPRKTTVCALYAADERVLGVVGNA
jgi:hypothetical protein